MESSTPLLTRVVQRDFDTLKLRFQHTEAPHVFWHIRNALQRVRGTSAARRRSEGVSFSTIPAPSLTAQKPLHQAKRPRQRLYKSDFVLNRVTAVRAQVIPRFNVLHKGGRSRGVPNMHVEDDDEEDDDLDDEDDDVYEDDDVSVLSWQMLGSGSPVRAEPVSDADEQLQFDTIAAGNIPTLFLGRAYTNGPVNLMALHKMQNLLEDMYYHLICPHRDEASRSTVDLLLRLCWMPHPSPHQNGANMYPDVSTALLDRGLDLTADDLALKSIADRHGTQAPPSTQDSTTDRDSDREGSQSRPTDSTRGSSQHGLPEPPRIAALAAQLPSEGLQTLFDCCSRVSSILLSLSSVVQDTPASGSKPSSFSSKHTASQEPSSKAASSSSSHDAATGVAASEIEQPTSDQPAAASDAADSSVSDQGGVVHGAADAGPAGCRDQTGTEKLQPHGRHANMRKMAEHLLQDKDRHRESAKESLQQGGEDNDEHRWGPLWRNQKKHKASTAQPTSRGDPDPDDNMHSSSLHHTDEHETNSQLHADSDAGMRPLDSSVHAGAATAADTEAEAEVSRKVSMDREDEEKSAAAVAAAVAAAEAVSQRVRDAAAKLSDVIDQMSRLLLPTPIPLGLAVLFSQTLPSYMGLAAASADQTALSSFCASSAGKSFRKHFDANIAAFRAQRAQRCNHFLKSSDDPNATDGSLAAIDPLNSALDRLSGAANSQQLHPQAGSGGGAELAGGGMPASGINKGAKYASDDSLAPQLLAGNDSALHKLPVFFVPGAKILLPVQGHAVQFWPMFLSRAHLMTWVHRAHEAMSLAWLARRRRDRQRGKRIIQARVARFFLWCRTSRGPGDGMAGGSLGSDSDGVDDNIPESSDDPSEVQDLMNELSDGGGMGGESDKSTVVISIGPSGFGKSVELVALGAVSLVCGAAESAAGAVDSALVALWGVRSLLGLRPKFSVQACSLGEAAEAARAWNSEATVAVKDAMHGRWDMLQREVDEIMAALARALQDETGASEGPTTIQLTVTPGSHGSASRGPFFMRRLLQHITRRGSPPTDGNTPTDAATASLPNSSNDSPSAWGTKSVDEEVRGGPQKAEESSGDLVQAGAEPSSSLGSLGDNGNVQQPGGCASGCDCGAGSAASAADEGSGPHTGATEWTGGTEGSRRFWRRRRKPQVKDSGCTDPGSDARTVDRADVSSGTDNAEMETKHASGDNEGSSPSPKGAALQPGDHTRNSKTIAADVARVSTGSQTTQQKQQNDRHVHVEGSVGGTNKQGGADCDADVPSGEGRQTSQAEDSILPRSVSEHLRQVLTHILGGPARRLMNSDESLQSSSSRWGKSAGSSSGGSPDPALMDSLRSGAEAGVGHSRINEESATALAAAGAAESAPPLRERLADFLSLAVAERHALVENMLAAQRNVDRGDVPPATVRELRRAERDSRVQLMHSLLAMGQELAAATSESDAAALRTTWITSVNSLLAIDQASGLSPLLPLSASSQHHVQQLRTAPAALNFLLSAATSLHGAARRNPQALSMLLEPASALFDIHSAFTLHHLAQQQHQDAATACFLGAYPGSTRLPPPRPHAPRYQVHSSRGLVPPPKPSNSHQHPSDTSNTVGAPADNHDASKSQSRHLPAASEGTQPRDADTQQGDTSHGDRVTISANGTRVHGAHRRWRFVLDALMPVVSQLDSHNSVALELDVEQLLGVTPPEMLDPKLATVTAAAPPFDTPEFRGLLLVGDVSMDSAKQQGNRHGGVTTHGLSPEINFGYLPALSEQRHKHPPP